ncbi:MAG: AraC family transcriptional regulator [Rhodoferax sp.]|nr:AraC family transcriptional regulator [Rhodoferax sp.]
MRIAHPPDGVLVTLRAMVAQRAQVEGRTDAPYAGLRYYRFSAPLQYGKTQRLVPGVVVVLQGSKTAFIHGRQLQYDATSCLVLGRETLCQATVVRADAGHPYLAIHLDLPPELIAKAMAVLADTAQGADNEASTATANDGQFVTAVDPEVLSALMRLVPMTDNPLDRASIAPLVVEEIVVRLLRSDSAAALRNAVTSSHAAARIHQSMEQIRAEFDRPLTVSALADAIAMSPSHYAHSFRAIAGVSPMRYLRDVRLEQARALLLAGQVRAGDAGLRVGFESPAHFAREFKRRYETPPGEYVRRMAAAWPQANAATDKKCAVTEMVADLGVA